jgi:hypothetical protein
MGKREYKHKMSKLIPGQWYYVDGYIFKYQIMGNEPELDEDDNWIRRTVVRHSGCFNLVGNFSSGGFFWKGETYGCTHIPDMSKQFPTLFKIYEQYLIDQQTHEQM